MKSCIIIHHSHIIILERRSHTHTIWYDGAGNILKTLDFKSQPHFYHYDALNRMTGHGATVSAADETYTYACGSKLTAYTDALGTASLSYDGLSRLTSYTDTNGNNIRYTYDALNRIASLTPAQGADYRTEYAYLANGSVSTVTVYNAGAAAVTSYAYNTTTGRLSERCFPTVNSQYIKTAYSYDAYGRLEYVVMMARTAARPTGESGGSTNLYRTQYAYGFIASGTTLARTEQAYSGGAWVNSDATQYQWDTLGRQAFEQRTDYTGGVGTTVYSITQAYDKNGNRTGYDKNVVAGLESSYGKWCNLIYTIDDVNQLTAISDLDDMNYSCANPTSGGAKLCFEPTGAPAKRLRETG